MKAELIEWAIDAETRKPSIKFVLMIMAYLADDDGVCIESKSMLAGYAGMSVQSIKLIIGELIASGMIERRVQLSETRQSLPNAYKLLSVDD